MKKLFTIGLSLALAASFDVSAQSWSILGNSGTNPATNFIGTTDNKAFKIRTNNQVRLSVTGAGKVGIGIQTPAARLDVAGPTNNTEPVVKANVKYTGGQDVIAISGISNPSDTSGIGVAGDGNFIGVQGLSNLIGVNGFGIVGVFGESAVNGATGEPTGVWAETNNGSFGNAIFGLSTNAAQNVSIWGVATDTAGAVDFAGYFQGNLLAWEYYAPSDARLKKDIKPMDNVLSKLTKIETANYKFKTEEFAKLHLPREKQNGFIADNIQQIFPELVKDVSLPAKYHPKTNELISEAADIKIVNYMGMIPVLTEAIKEQQAVIESKNTQIENLQSQLAAFEKRLAAIENTNAEINAKTKVTLNGASLEQNRPNPFTQVTSIKYTVPADAHSAQLLITAADGSVVKTIALKNGKGEVMIQANELAAGSYVYTLLVDGVVSGSKSLVLTR